jgi:hypothetical protein
MFGAERYFYHGLLKDVVVLFGNLFNNLYISRVEPNGLTSLSKVPLNYGPKSKYLARIELNPSGEVQTNNMVLPRMAFEITGMNYDPLRRVNGQETANIAGSPNTKSVYDAIPYNIQITLSIISRNSEDAIQIVEQIIPNFTPEFTLTYEKDFESFSAPIRIPVVLESVQNQDEYEGDFKTRRAIVWTLGFTCKTVILSDIKNRNVILNTQVNNFMANFNNEDLPEGVEDFFASGNPFLANSMQNGAGSQFAGSALSGNNPQSTFTTGTQPQSGSMQTGGVVSTSAGVSVDSSAVGFDVSASVSKTLDVSTDESILRIRVQTSGTDLEGDET